MKDILKLLQQLDQFKRLKEDLSKGINCWASGLWGSSAAYLLSAIADGTDKNVCPTAILFITPTVDEAEESFQDINLFFSPPQADKALLFPPREDTATTTMRLNVLQTLLSNADCGLRIAESQKDAILIPHSAFHIPQLIVAPIQAILQDVPSIENLLGNSLVVRKGQEYTLEKALEWVKAQDFTRVPLVEMPGEFSLRGGILDIYPYASSIPYRIEFFGDAIESLREFNVETQVSEREIEECQFLGKVDSYTSQHNETLLDYLPEDTLIVLKEPQAIEAKAGMIHELPLCSFSYETLNGKFHRHTILNLLCLPITEGLNHHIFHVDSIERIKDVVTEDASSHLSTIINELSCVCGLNTRTIVFCNNDAEKQRFHELMGDAAPHLEKRLELRMGHLSHGFQFRDISIALLPHHEIFKRYKQR
ncbi:MAG TPA: hypothetical protein VI387_08325, partial [Candidatus Brocadiales bacterium]|nr:hypothetical protein [Candidatus Brocadiales bacterium]